MGLSSYQSFCLLTELGVPTRLVRLLGLDEAPGRSCDGCNGHSVGCSGDRSNVRLNVCPSGLSGGRSDSRSDNRSGDRSYLSDGCSNNLPNVLSKGCSCDLS